VATRFGKSAFVRGVALLIASTFVLGACAPATQVPQPTTAAPTSAPAATSASATTAPTSAAAATAAPTAAGSGQQIELVVWQVPNSPTMQQIMENMVKPFEQANNIKVTIVVVPWSDLDTQWESAIQTRQTPSFGYMYDFRLPTYYRSGALEPLDQDFSKDELSKYLEQPLSTAMYQGHLYAMPFLVSSDALLYNKAIFQKAGITPPTDPNYSPTWEEFLGWAQKIKAAGFASYDYGFRDIWNHPMDDFYNRFGCHETNDDHTKMTFDTPECAKAVQAWVDLAPTLSEKAKSTAWSPLDEFFAGQVGMAEGGVGVAQQLVQKYPNVDFGVMQPFHDKEYKDYLGIGYYAVFADAKNKPQVIQLLKFLTNEDNQVSFNAAIGTFPALKDTRGRMFPDATGVVKTVADVVWEQLQGGRSKFLYPWPGFSEFADKTFIPNWESLMLGKMSQPDFIKVIQTQGQAAIDANKNSN